MNNSPINIYDDHILTYEAVYQIYMNAPSPIRIIDMNYNILTQNPAMDTLVSMRNPESQGKKCFEITRAPGLCNTENCPLQQITRKVNSNLALFYECELWNKKQFPCHVISSPFYDSHGQLVGIIQTIQDDTHYVAMADALEKKNQELAANYQLLENQYKIIRLLHETTELSEMAQKLLDTLVKDIRSATGVFYIWDNERCLLSPIASHAIFTNPPEFGLGQGMPGQAAQTKQTLLVQNLPADHLKLKAATIDAYPFSIICIPLLLQDRLLGLIELGSFDDLSSHKQYLENILSQTCFAIQNAIHRQEIIQLSNTMKEQNEQLNAQNEELQAQSEELQAQSEEIQAQTEELIAQKEALEKKTREAEEANRMKSIFLSNMSHELRTPLNSILGLARLMLDDYQVTQNQRHKEYLNIMLRNGENLLELINDILDLTRIESGREEMRFTPFKTRDLIEKLSMSITPLAQKNNLVFEIQIDEAPETIVTDQRRLNQILTNLLGNAIKFTEKGGITLKCTKKITEDRDYAIFEVIDTGIGIPKGYEKVIFEPFKQVDDSYTRKYGGTGLGLSISQKLAHMLGGEISVSSELGKGSTFTLTIPMDRRSKNRIPDDVWKKRLKDTMLLKRDKIHAASLSDSSVYTKDTSKSITTKTTETLKQPATAPCITTSTTGQRILLVDDDILVLKELGNRLKSLGYEVSYAFDGQLGLKLLLNENPQLVILDLTMPVMDGFSFLHEMQKLPNLAETPVIILSAADIGSDMEKMLPSNVKGILQKGNIKSQELIALLKETLIGTKQQVATTKNTYNQVTPDMTQNNKKILIVEDNSDNMFLLKELLTPKGYVVLHAINGNEAVQIAMAQQPNIILMDIQMPEMNGLDATKTLRRNGLKIPIIALTAKAMKGDKEQILEAGCNDYISKPFNPSSLLSTIEYWLK